MAQIMIDTDTESIAGLMTLVRMLTDFAAIKATQQQALEEERPKLSDHTHPNPVLTVSAPTSGTLEPGMTVVDSQGNNLGTLVAPESEPDPTKLFGKFPVPTGATNVVPLFPQPALNLPGATGPAVLGVPAVTNTGQPATTAATQAPAENAQPAAGASGVVSAEVDSQGIPWDARIHSSSKKTKGDGTWKLARNLPEGLAQQVTAELLARKLPVNVAAVSPGTSAPTTAAPQNAPTTSPVPALAGTAAVNAGSLPVHSAVPVLPGAGVGLPNTNNAGVVPPLTPTVSLPLGGAVPVPTPQSAVPVLPGNLPGQVPSAGGVPVAPESPVKRFGAMMAKISAALGDKRITQQQVLDAHKAPTIGLDQLQQAVLHPEKIPLIEAALGLA